MLAQNHTIIIHDICNDIIILYCIYDCISILCVWFDRLINITRDYQVIFADPSSTVQELPIPVAGLRS